MSATAKVVRDFLARVDAGRVEPEDFGLTAEDVEALRDEHGGIPLVNGARIREDTITLSKADAIGWLLDAREAIDDDGTNDDEHDHLVSMMDTIVEALGDDAPAREDDED